MTCGFGTTRWNAPLPASRALPQISRHGHHRAGIHRPALHVEISCPENFYEKDISSYEQALTDLRKALLAKELSADSLLQHRHLHHAGKLCPVGISWRTACSSSPTKRAQACPAERLGGGQRHVCLHLSGHYTTKIALRQQTVGILQE